MPASLSSPLMRRALALAAPVLIAACGPSPSPPPQPAPAPTSAPATQAPAPRGPFFEDVTEKSGIRFAHDRGAEGKRYMPETMGSGGCALDADGDGLLDLYLVQSGPIPGSGSTRPRAGNALFRNRGDGTFEDISAGSGADDAGYGMGATCADYDNDGDTDIFVANFGQDVLLANDGHAHFSDVTRRAGLSDGAWGSSAAFLDADLDGDVDLYVANYLDFTVAKHVPCKERGVVEAYCHPDVHAAVPDVYLENRGDGTFVDATARAGLAETTGKGLGVVVLDFDDDADPDIYVANDTTPNILWRNDGTGRFANVALEQGVAYSEQGTALAGMGLDAGDVDGNGRLDLVVTNFGGEPNSLYLGGDRAFKSGGRRMGIHGPSLPVLGFGADFLDANDDGNVDLLVVNGHIIDNIAQADPAQSYAQAGHLFLNDGAGHLRLLTAGETGSFAAPVVGRGSITWDPDDDGRLDVVVTTSGERTRLHRNVRPPDGHWVGFLLQGTKGNRDGIGARVIVEAGGKRWIDERHGGSSYQTSGDPRLHFGVGAAATIDRVTIRWSASAVEVHENIAADQYYRVVEGRAPERIAR